LGAERGGAELRRAILMDEPGELGV